MGEGVARGEIWLHAFGAPDKRRPVVVLSRKQALAAMHTVIVVPITSTIRGLPSEVPLGIEDGLKAACVATLDHVQVVHRNDLRHRVSKLSDQRMAEICRALAFATGCGT